MSENKQALQVAALKNGTVIDHIPSEKLFTVVQLLGVEQMTSNITISRIAVICFICFCFFIITSFRKYVYL